MGQFEPILRTLLYYWGLTQVKLLLGIFSFAIGMIYLQVKESYLGGGFFMVFGLGLILNSAGVFTLPWDVLAEPPKKVVTQSQPVHKPQGTTIVLYDDPAKAKPQPK